MITLLTGEDSFEAECELREVMTLAIEKAVVPIEIMSMLEANGEATWILPAFFAAKACRAYATLMY